MSTSDEASAAAAVVAPDEPTDEPTSDQEAPPSTVAEVTSQTEQSGESSSKPSEVVEAPTTTAAAEATTSPPAGDLSSPAETTPSSGDVTTPSDATKEPESPSSNEAAPAAAEPEVASEAAVTSETATTEVPTPEVPTQTPRVVIVTGASSGIGYHVARLLSVAGHDVILACRNEQKANRAVEKIVKEKEDARATYMHLDLADMESIRKFAAAFQATGKQLSVLVNNAGVTMNVKDTQRQYTKDNFELTMGTNHLGHFLLTNLLLNDLKKTAADGGDARVVVVTSLIHDPAVSKKTGVVHPINLDDLFLFNEASYSGLQAYKNSKLANVMFAYELARQLADSGVKVNAVDPGFVPSTELLRHSSGVQKFYARYILHGLLRFRKQTRTGSQAASDICLVAIGDQFKDETGKYIQQGQVVKSSDESLDETKQKQLWELSARYTRLDGFEPLIATRPVDPTPPASPSVANGSSSTETKQGDKDTDTKNAPENTATEDATNVTDKTVVSKEHGNPDGDVGNKASTLEGTGGDAAVKKPEEGTSKNEDEVVKTKSEVEVAAEIVAAVVESAVMVNGVEKAADEAGDVVKAATESEKQIANGVEPGSVPV
jgi:light-dependent protochlorophyllide reductase